MKIVEAEKRCEELTEQMIAIRKEYDFGGYAKYCGEKKIDPLRKERDKLLLAIMKAKEMFEIDAEENGDGI